MPLVLKDGVLTAPNNVLMIHKSKCGPLFRVKESWISLQKRVEENY